MNMRKYSKEYMNLILGFHLCPRILIYFPCNLKEMDHENNIWLSQYLFILEHLHKI